jgi:hypothetical protein
MDGWPRQQGERDNALNNIQNKGFVILLSLVLIYKEICSNFANCKKIRIQLCNYQNKK